MSKKTRRRTPVQKTAQAIKTRKNQKKRYEKLLKDNPSSPHKDTWKKYI